MKKLIVLGLTLPLCIVLARAGEHRSWSGSTVTMNDDSSGDDCRDHLRVSNDDYRANVRDEEVKTIPNQPLTIKAEQNGGIQVTTWDKPEVSLKLCKQIATDNEGLLLIDQHVAHERILFDKYRALESARLAESQQLLIPETFDLTPAQVSIFDVIASELENYGFELMRLSGRTVAIKATPADLPAGEARNMLAEILDTVDAEKKGAARETLRDDIAASLACHAAIKVNMPLSPEKMRWLIDRLLKTSSPTTCPHGRPVILRLATRDILKGFHRI